ncbi:MAG: AAA family ATPase [Candidatus Sulfotelmatobacter sp.]
MDGPSIRIRRSLRPAWTISITRSFLAFPPNWWPPRSRTRRSSWLRGRASRGKTTLVRDLVAGNREFITMDDDTVLAAARSDPTGFVRLSIEPPLTMYSECPTSSGRIKKSVDDNRRAGRFLLTGSANILTVPQTSESLAGRMEIVSFLPLSRAEIRDKKPDFLKAAFDGKLRKPAGPMVDEDVVQAVLIGGYPEMLRREDPKRRRTWARDYIRAIVQRDVREVADAEKLDQCRGCCRFSPPLWPAHQFHADGRPGWI